MIGLKALSDTIVWSKYAKYIPELNRRETWDEIVDRYEVMMMKKYPSIKNEIVENGKWIREKKVLPSMRALQFAGAAIEVNNVRGYNCFGKETEFVTSEGLRAFSDFKDGDEITVLTHLGNWKKAVVKNYGKQDLNEVTIVRGRHSHSVKVTANHRWILKDGTETTSLKISDKLLSCPSIFNEFDYDDVDPIQRLYWAYGYIFGDGTKVKKREEYKYSMVRLCGKDKNRFLYRFTELGFSNSSPVSIKGDVIVYTGEYLKTAPDPSIDSPELIRAFIAGYLDADGGKQRSQTALSKFQSIVSTGEEHKYVVEKLFPIAGVFISSFRDISGRMTNFGKRGDSNAYSISTNLTSLTNMSFIVKEITKNVSNEEVWCLEVEDDRSFILKHGVVTGNCSYLPVDSYHAFSETMFLLLGGSGVGYSVQKHHVNELPAIIKPSKSRRYLIQDSIIGWSDAVKVLMKSYFSMGGLPDFDYRDIRAKGTPLKTAGGKAPGPEPLKICLTHIQAILDRKKDGDKLTPLECHDILCHIANSVLSGGIRRSAMIALFGKDDEEMLTCKYGDWWETNEQRGRANNSVVLMRGEVEKEEFDALWKRVKASGSGEPGIYWTNDNNILTNPCGEISLNAFQLCNLCELNVSNVESQKDLNKRAEVAAFFGTLQAGFTDFHYLRPIWKRTTEREALLGIGQTGIGSGEVLKYDLKEAAKVAVEKNAEVADKIGINRAARVTCVKPAGTSSCVVESSSGIGAWYDEWFLRTVRFNVNESVAQYFLREHPEYCEVDVLKPKDTICVRFPIKAPKGSLLRHETPITTLERVKKYRNEWIMEGHNSGSNPHNVSVTVFLKDEEWEEVGNWMWVNKDSYNGISVLPYDGGTYTQAPFETITEEEYEKRATNVHMIDLTKVKEGEDNVQFNEIAACAGGACEVNL